MAGNLRFTARGVYADYLVSGLPFIFTARDWQDRVAAAHAELLRTLPSGAMLSGLTTPVATRNITRRMLSAHPDLHPDNGSDTQSIAGEARAWIAHCQLWEHAVTRSGARRRVHWLSLPLDYGPAGRTPASSWRRTREVVVGRDRDTEATITGYRAVAAAMVAALPPALFVKPASAQQIWWHWNYTASRGVWPHPLPTQTYHPDARLPGSAFSPVWLDPSAAVLRGRRWRAARSDADVFVRAYRGPDDGVPDSYQAVVGIERFPDTGIAWPRATLFKVLDDLTTPVTTLDWTIHVTFDTAEAAISAAHNVLTNIKDQGRQRGRHAFSDDELIRKLASGRELASELKRGSAERGVNAAVVVTAAGAGPETVNAALSEVLRCYRGQNLGLTRRRGSQVMLWGAGNPGTEMSAALHELRSPSTTARFAKFVPLLANRLGNNVGVPLGVNVTSPGLHDVVLLDLLNAPARENAANLVICGSPGRGKSSCGKNLTRSWLALGAGVHIFDPTEAREHERALGDVEKVVIDPARPRFSLDGLRIFAFDDAAEHTVDHLLPQLGFSPLSPQAQRLHAHLSPECRARNGIGSHRQLIRYLRDLRGGRVGADDDLLVGLEGLATQRLLRPLFDESLPVPDLAAATCVIWNFGGLELPTVGAEYTAHLHQQSTPGQRAAQALYGLGAALAQSLFFARPDQPDMLIVEECAAWTHSPGGQKCANTVIRQGRKAWTGFLGISQQPIKDFHEVLEDEFIDQRLCLGFRDADLAAATLRWCGRDLDRHPELLTDYVNNTSPVQVIEHGDDAIRPGHGKVVPGREGEGWYLDEFGGFGKVRLFAAPTPGLARRYDTNPHRNRHVGLRT